MFVVESMFDDGVINPGRLRVLDAYTRDVCRQVQNPQPIRGYYTEIVLPTLLSYDV